MKRVVTDDLGMTIECFWWKRISEWLSLPPTCNIPSLSRNGLRSWSFALTAMSRSLRSVFSSLEKWLICSNLMSLLCAVGSWPVVKGAARFCFCFHWKQRAVILINLAQEEISLISYDRRELWPDKSLLSASVCRPMVLGSTSASILQVSVTTLVHFAKRLGAEILQTIDLGILDSRIVGGESVTPIGGAGLGLDVDYAVSYKGFDSMWCWVDPMEGDGRIHPIDNSIYFDC